MSSFKSDDALILKFLFSLLIKLQLNDIFSAVSNLSPVNIQIFIPAQRRSFIVSGTLSCNLSSTIVTPNNVKFCSISL